MKANIRKSGSDNEHEIKLPCIRALEADPMLLAISAILSVSNMGRGRTEDYRRKRQLNTKVNKKIIVIILPLMKMSKGLAILQYQAEISSLKILLLLAKVMMYH